MASASGHDFVGILARAWPPQYSSPSLCEQSELQCFASDLRCMFAQRRLLKGRVFKILIKSSLAAASSQRRFAAGSHNRLLRRQHCSSLCSQSEGHEHVANMASALGHDFVGISARAWPPQFSSPHFASKVSYSASPQVFAACSRSAYSFRVPLWGGWAAACGCCARDKLFVLWMLAFFVVDVFGLTKGQKKWDTSVSRPC